MLLDVVIATETDGPPVRWLEPGTAVGVTPNMRALDGSSQATRHAAMMPTHPGAMSRTLAAVRLAGPLTLKPVR